MNHTVLGQGKPTFCIKRYLTLKDEAWLYLPYGLQPDCFDTGIDSVCCCLQVNLFLRGVGGVAASCQVVLRVILLS